jgi:transposase
MRGEVLGPERQRQWSEDEKARIIEESLRPGAQVADIARRHCVSRALLYSWRRAARCVPVSPVTPPPEFVPAAASGPLVLWWVLLVLILVLTMIASRIVQNLQ